MKTKSHTMEACLHTGLMLALCAGTLLPLVGHAWASEGAGNKAAALAEIKVSLKMDSRLTRGLYMGDRWASAPTYTGAGGQDTVDAKAEGRDAKGMRVAIRPEWIASDPEMVMVSPTQGPQTRITVKRAGESRLRVTSGGVSQELAIKAVQAGGPMQLEIAQLPPERSAAPAENAPAFANEKDKLSYAVGANLGNTLRKQSVEVDPELLIQGFKEALSGGETRLSEDQVRETLTALQTQLRTRQTEQSKQLAEKNKQDGEAYLARNKDNDGVVTLESGLQYKILRAGDGNKPSAEDTVVCHYRGTLIDGTEFDTSYKRGKPASFAVTNVIRGWREALQLMPAGSKWQLFIPSDLAYGERGSRGKIGPNATLIFEVELISVQGKS